MAYSEVIAKRIRDILSPEYNFEEKKMFGGLAFMINEKMCVGVTGDELMARIDPELYEDALKKKGVREMNFTGKPMKGFVFVSEEGISTKKLLEYWLNLSLECNKKIKTAKKRN